MQKTKIDLDALENILGVRQRNTPKAIRATWLDSGGLSARRARCVSWAVTADTRPRVAWWVNSRQTLSVGHHR